MRKPTRRTLKMIDHYPSPSEIYRELMESDGWPYKTDLEFYHARDKALVSILYLLGLRVSEALRLRRNQFIHPDEPEGRPDRIVVRDIVLSKSRVKGRPRRSIIREGWLPLTGERAPLTRLVDSYLQLLNPRDRLFKFSRQRAWQIVTANLPYTCHWLRAFCEDYLYSRWMGDLLAVADYVKVDARTLQEYIRRRYERYQPV